MAEEIKAEQNNVTPTGGKKKKLLIGLGILFILIVLSGYPLVPIKNYIKDRVENPTTLEEFKNIIEECSTEVSSEYNQVSDEEYNSQEFQLRVKDCVDSRNKNDKLDYQIAE